MSVIDVALEYGYESHSAFTRAIKEQFGVPPKLLTFDILKNNLYARFSFQQNETYYVMKGKRIMADLVKITYEEMGERKIIGISRSTMVGGVVVYLLSSYKKTNSCLCKDHQVNTIN